MSKVVILTTGGTIASTEDKKTGLLKAGILTGDELISINDLFLDSEVEVIAESIFQIPSNYMTFNHLLILKEKIEQIFKNNSTGGIVITHGTNTLEETAYFLDLTISNENPIIITGSQRGPTELGTDAFTNIRQSVIAASDIHTKGIGTMVLFNERIFSARYVKKIHSYNTNAFSSFGYGYLGIVDRNRVFIYQKPIQKEFYKIGNSIPIVDIIKISLGSNGKFIYCSVKSGSKGIVLEGAGRGHIPPQAVEAVDFAIAHGVKVVLTTSCEEGEVFPVYDFTGGVKDLQDRGVITGKDYDSKKARIKLSVLLAAGIDDIECIQKSFLR
jgi:L-asparaginase